MEFFESGIWRRKRRRWQYKWNFTGYDDHLLLKRNYFFGSLTCFLLFFVEKMV